MLVGGADNPTTASRASASTSDRRPSYLVEKPSRSIVRRSVVRWNGVCWHDIKSGGVEMMISLAGTTTLLVKKFLSKCTNYRRHRL